MNMQPKRLIYASILIVISLLPACDGLLDIPPQGKLDSERFWLSKDQTVAAIAGIYSNFGSSAGMSASSISPVESFIFWGDLRGEMMAINPGKLPTDQVAKEKIDNLTTSPADVSTKFTQFYRIINYANQAIKYIPGIKAKDPAFTDEDEANLSGEAYFLRAFAYFWLVRTFKEVPLVLEPSETDDQNYNIRKSPADSVFMLIASDLELAKQKLPEWYSNAQYPRCRATKYTAMTLLADVYLWMAALSDNQAAQNGFYDKVITNCDGVINSKRYTMVPGVSFGSIFTIGNSDESIFETYANYKVNNQVNNLYSWFNTSGYFLVPTPIDELYTKLGFADYRGPLPPAGPYPEKGAAVGYLTSSRYVNKYAATTKDPRWVFYRYPEVLMMKAEALAHRYVDDQNRLNQAAALINQIRFRAFGINEYPVLSVSSTYQMDNELLDELGREFVGEGKRWFQLVRFASRNNFAAKELLIDRIVNSFSGVDQLVISPRVSNPDSWYLPLNADALAANPNLVQNPYYD